MASFPSPKVHRPSRRRLGRGQFVQQPSVTATPNATLAVVVITFDVPVIVRGDLNLHLSGPSDPLLSQVINSPTQITQTYTSSVIAKTWSIDGGDPNVSSFQGGVVAAAAGTF